MQPTEKQPNAHILRELGELRKPIQNEQQQQVLNANLPRVTYARPAARASYGPDVLRAAIAGGQLNNHYQPKVDVISGAVVGVETLVRWQHPQDGLIYPDQFISTAEEFGLIDALTQAVLAEALLHGRRWQNAGLELSLAVNVSMDNLATLKFPDLVEREALKAGIPLSSLMLELTESRLMKDLLAPLDILTRLRLKHIGLSFVVFGTGHSSLAQLRDLPFDELKIDRGFVHGAWCNPSLRAFFVASFAMARQLNMKVVAEGVEDLADWEFLRTAGCDLAQGYFIAKPMPAADLPDWVKAWELRRPTLNGQEFSTNG